MTGSEYIERVKSSRCVICWHRLSVNISPCDAHHVGLGEERDDFLVAALCKQHHQGATGVHHLHRKGFERMWKVTPMMLVSWTIQEVMRGSP